MMNVNHYGVLSVYVTNLVIQQLILIGPWTARKYKVIKYLAVIYYTSFYRFN